MSKHTLQSFQERLQDCMDRAGAKGMEYPNAMTLATVSKTGQPSARVVLLKGMDERGFVFYTNLQSQKGREALGTGRASLSFYWDMLFEQVRIEGVVEQVDDALADDYFSTRPRGSQIGAWASVQSQPLRDRAVLDARVEEFEERFEMLGEVPRPPHWSGLRVVPTRVEFWVGRTYRLHDRFVYTPEEGSTFWSETRLFP